MTTLRVIYCRTSKTLPFCPSRQLHFPVTRTSYQSKCGRCTSSCTQILQLLNNSRSRYDFLKSPILHRTLSDEPRKKRRLNLLVKTLKEYGPVFVLFHTCTSIATFAVFYILVSRGVDVSTVVSFAESYINVDSMLSKAGYDRSVLLSPASSNTTSGIIAFLLYKLTSPIRLILDSIMVPIVVRNLRYMGVMEPESAVNEQTLEMAISRIEEFDKKYDEIDLGSTVHLIRRRVAKRNERRDRQMKKYAETQRKIDKVFQKKKAGESKNEK